MPNKLKNIAVLIDADNTPRSQIKSMIERVEKFGQIGIKKIYGDWGNNYLKSWQSIILEYAMVPVHQFSYTKGKNATDISMVIDAMDLVLENIYDGFCLVSSDSDFAPLAARLRANNIKVFGFGKPNTPDAFKKACDEFVCFDEEDNNSNAEVKLNHLPLDISTQTKNKTIPKQVKNLLLTVMDQNTDENGWVKLEVIASSINKVDSSFNFKDYNFAKFSTFIKSIPEIEIKNEGGKYLCKRKQNNTSINPKNVPQKIKNLILEAIEHNKDEEGWAKIGQIGGWVKNHDTGFSSKAYGFAKLSSLLKSLPEVELKVTSSVALCRCKNSPLSSHEENQKKVPRLNKEQVIQEIMVLLKNSPHKKGWVSLSTIEKHLKSINPHFNSQDYDFPNLSAFLGNLNNVQSLVIPKYKESQEKHYRKIPFLKLVKQLKQVANRVDIDIRDLDGTVKACALGQYAHFHVYYGKYGFSFPSFLEQVAEYEKRKTSHAE